MKNNRKGNVAVFRFKNTEKFNIEDLMYVDSQKKSIERMFVLLRKVQLRSLNNENIKSLTKVIKESKVDLKIISLLKRYNYIDDGSKWILDSAPSRADAIFLRIKLRDLFRKKIKP